MSDWRTDHDAMKAHVGMAPYGSVQYFRNAARVLATHRPYGRRIAQEALKDC
jgi:hypothetical protein